MTTWYFSSVNSRSGYLSRSNCGCGSPNTSTFASDSPLLDAVFFTILTGGGVGSGVGVCGGGDDFAAGGVDLPPGFGFGRPTIFFFGFGCFALFGCLLGCGKEPP